MSIFDSPDIQKLKNHKNINGLQKALRNKDPKVVLESALALAEFGVYSSKGLIIGTSDNDWQIRNRTYITYSALQCYGFIPLINALHDPHEKVRASCVTALLFKRDKRAIKVLGKCLLNEPSSLVRETISTVLVSLGEDESHDYLVEAKNNPDSKVSNSEQDELERIGGIRNSQLNNSSEKQSLDELFSLYGIWEDLNLIISEDFKNNESKIIKSKKAAITPYDSPLGISCKKWMLKVGDAIKLRDEKVTYKYLWNIANATQESFNLLSTEGLNSYMIKPYIELNQASNLILNSQFYDMWF